MSSEILEKYKSEIPSISKEKLIGRKRYETMLVGCLPFGDQELYFNTLSSRSAMLLAGRQGCGKRTLESAFINGYGEMFSAALSFPFEDIAAEGDEKAAAQLTDFLKALEEYTDGEDENSEDAYIVTLGNITSVKDMPKLCAALSAGVRNIVKNGKGVIVMTAVYDGDVRSIPAAVRKPFVVCRVDPPSREERLEFFKNSMEPVSGYVNDTVGIDFMADYTEGTTFDDLDSLICDLHVFLKAKFVVDVAETSGSDISEVEMADIGIDKVNLEKDDFIFLADSYREEKQEAAGFDMSAITEALSNLTVNLSSDKEPEKPKAVSPFALLDDDDDPDALF